MQTGISTTFHQIYTVINAADDNMSPIIETVYTSPLLSVSRSSDLIMIAGSSSFLKFACMFQNLDAAC
jgi:hypothetical protein